VFFFKEILSGIWDSKYGVLYCISSVRHGILNSTNYPVTHTRIRNIFELVAILVCTTDPCVCMYVCMAVTELYA
jgi:hypothetical protein